jgi:hypothetical protein
VVPKIPHWRYATHGKEKDGDKLLSGSSVLGQVRVLSSVGALLTVIYLTASQDRGSRREAAELGKVTLFKDRFGERSSRHGEIKGALRIRFSRRLGLKPSK